jgi:hypothetical protein
MTNFGCFRCEEHGEPNDALRHTHGDSFRVGMGGFVFDAMRRILVKNLYGVDGSTPPHGVPRREIYGTEAIHELLIDVVDSYGTVPTWGPYKDCLNDGHNFVRPTPTPKNPQTAAFLAYWMLAKHACREIPMFQYVYNSVMPIKMHNATLSRGTSAGRNNVGDAFYWLAAQTYLNGMILSATYGNNPNDVLSNPENPDDPDWMDPKTPTYVLGWGLDTNDPEHVPAKEIRHPYPLRDRKFAVPASGKHPFLGSGQDHEEFIEKFRTYGDADKMRFVRMLAYLRSWVLPDFLVKGDMLRPAVLEFAELPDGPRLSYSYYWSMKPLDCDHEGGWVPEKRLLSLAWREAPGSAGGSFHGVDLPRVAYLVANIDKLARDCLLKATLDLYGDRSAMVSTMQANPEVERSWDHWHPEISVVHPQNGKLSIRRNLSLQPREVAVIRLTPQGRQS